MSRDYSDLGVRSQPSPDIMSAAPVSGTDYSDLGIRSQSSAVPSLGQEVSSLGKGTLSGLAGGGLDLASMIYNLPAMFHNFQSQQQSEFQRTHPQQAAQLERHYGQPMEAYPELPLIPSATEAIERGVDTATGGYTDIPQGNLYEGAKFAGSLGGLGGLGKAAIKLGAPTVGKIAKSMGSTAPTEIAAAVPAGATLNAVNEEYGPLAGLGAGALTGALTTKGLSGFVQGAKGTFSGKGPSLGEMTVGRAISLMGQPSQAVETLLKKYNQTVPFNVRLQGPVAHFIGNTGMSTAFKTKRYTDIVDNAPKQLVEKVVKEIDSIHPGNLGSQEVNNQYKEFLEKEQKIVKKNAENLYNTSYEYLKPNETISFPHTVKAIKELKKDLSAPDPSPSQKFVIARINKLGEHFGIIKPPKGTLGFKDIELESPHLFKKVMEHLEKNPNFTSEVLPMVQQRQAYMDMINYGDVRGVKAKLGKVIGAITQDIDNTSNKEFLNHWKAANSYYRMESANRVRSDIANSLTQGTLPTEAYKYMSSARRVNQLKKIIGDSSNANKIFNGLKRAKLQDVVLDKITDKDGVLNNNSFIKLFSKGNENQDLLQTLLGKGSYNKIRELTDISKEISHAAKQFQNISGTAKVAQDIAKVTGVGYGLLDLLTTGGIGKLAYGAAGVGAPYMLSRALSNPRYIDAAVNYGLARKSGNFNKATHYQKSMKNMFYDMMKKQAPMAINKQLEDQ